MKKPRQVGQANLPHWSKIDLIVIFVPNSIRYVVMLMGHAKNTFQPNHIVCVFVNGHLRCRGIFSLSFQTTQFRRLCLAYDLCGHLNERIWRAGTKKPIDLSGQTNQFFLFKSNRPIEISANKRKLIEFLLDFSISTFFRLRRFFHLQWNQKR